MSLDSGRFPKSKPLGLLALLSLGTALLLGGCLLDRRAIVWNTNVEPSIVCPGDSVRLSYQTAEGGCLGDGCPPIVEVDVQVDGSDITDGLHMSGSDGSSIVGPVTGPSTFTFTTTGGRYGEARDPESHSVDVLIPMAESPVALNVGATCSGDAVYWEPIDLGVPRFRSEAVRLVRVCNTSANAVSLVLVFAHSGGSPSEQRWTLLPGMCTENLPRELGTVVSSAVIVPIAPGGPPVSCTTSSSGVPRGFQLQGILTCDSMSASSPIVAASPEATTTTEIYVLPTLTPAPTATPTEAPPPQVTLLQNANCRKGPGTGYDVITSLTKGVQSPVTGRNEPSTWWQVQVPATEILCWISGISVQPPGDPENVPVLTVQPVPGAPGALTVTDSTCSPNLNAFPVELGWNDASGETGYRLYRNGTLLLSLNANATAYEDLAPKATALTYELEAFNALGKAERLAVSVPACK
jgi:hypothetical protein